MAEQSNFNSDAEQFNSELKTGLAEFLQGVWDKYDIKDMEIAIAEALEFQAGEFRIQHASK